MAALASLGVEGAAHLIGQLQAGVGEDRDLLDVRLLALGAYQTPALRAGSRRICPTTGLVGHLIPRLTRGTKALWQGNLGPIFPDSGHVESVRSTITLLPIR